MAHPLVARPLRVVAPWWAWPAALCLTACGGQGASSDVGRTAVPVTLQVRLAATDAVAGQLVADAQDWTLRAYALDGLDTPVPLRPAAAAAAAAGAQAGAAALQVRLGGGTSTVQAVLLADAATQAAGVGLQLQPASATATFAGYPPVGEATPLRALVPNLEGAEDAGVTAEASLAQGLATSLAQATFPASTWQARLPAVQALTTALQARQAALEGNVVVGRHAVARAASELSAALAAQLAGDAATQARCAAALADAAGALGDGGATAQALASRYDQALQRLALGARNVLNAAAGGGNALFAADEATNQRAALAAVAERGASAAYTPQLRGFTDADVTADLGGVLQIGAAPVPSGIDGYAVYLGGNTLLRARNVWLGQVAVNAAQPAADVNFVLPSGTVQPSDDDTFWVFPRSAGRELTAAATLPLRNARVGVPTASATALASAVRVSWQTVAGADSYNLYRGSQATLGKGDLLVRGASAPYVDANVVVGTPLYYAVSALQKGVESSLSAAVQAAPAGPAAPTLTATADAGGGNVTLTWTPTPYADSYTVYTVAAGNVTLAAAQQPNLTARTLQVAGGYTHPGKAAVTGTVRGVSSPLSNQVVLQAKLAPPQDVTATTPAAGEVVLAWSPVDGAVSYNVVSALHTGLTAADATLATPTNLVALINLTNSVANTFAVQAVDAAGNVSGNSAETTLLPGVVVLANGSDAAGVLGQGSVTTRLNAVDAGHFAGAPAAASWSDSYSNLYVADAGGNRVMGFQNPGTAAVDANVVLGQADATSNVAGAGLYGLHGPTSVHAEGTTLWICDAANRRVLTYADPSTSVTGAGLVVGAPSLADPANAAPSATGLVGPVAARTGGGRLVVVDAAAHRVLLYNQLPTSDDAAADVVLGQPDFVSAVANNGGVSAASLATPSDAYTDGTRLLVYDYGNSRVLVYNAWPTQNAQAADVVVGQADMVHAGGNGGAAAPHARGLAPHGVADAPLPGLACNGAALAISDPGNNRVLLYNAVPTQNDAPADGVLGQRLLTTRTSNNPPQQNTLSRPSGVAFAGATALYVVDAGNNRVLRFAP